MLVCNSNVEHNNVYNFGLITYVQDTFVYLLQGTYYVTLLYSNYFTLRHVLSNFLCYQARWKCPRDDRVVHYIGMARCFVVCRSMLLTTIMF